ncbi:MAG: TonB-dependent receptor plug domain-containing protein, partial [Deltaproteobacteria bacterium]
MKLRALAIVGVLLCWVSATPAAGSEGTNNNGATADETALMNLYFGKEQLVEVATSYPKPISQVAEDVTVVTAEEIEAMHAHSVAEVLERVPGVFVTFHGRGEPGIGSGLSIQDSDYEHVLVLVDGIRWNSVDVDFPETNDIPVNIIDRIEVIKGAASSTWGSALGGVVNIITKKTGTDARPHGFAQVGIGEHGTRSYQGEVAGGLSDFGYYLYAGREEADGILNNRFFDSKNLFGKFSYELSRTHFSGEIGFSQPENRYTYVLRPDLGSWADFTDISEGRALFYSVDMANDLTDSLHFYLQYYGRENDYTTSDLAASTGDLFTKTTAEGDQRGVNSRLAW